MSLTNLPDLDLLHTFVTVAQYRSISQAASVLKLTQPAVSKKIQRLEEQFDTPLIDRSARPLSLTISGNLLLEHAAPLLRSAFALTAEIRQLADKGMPVLRLGMPDSLSEILGAEFITSMQGMASYIQLKSGISPWLETAFKSRNFDIAVDMPPFSYDDQYQLHHLFNDPYIIVAPKSMIHRSLEDIIETENYVGYGRTSKFGAECTAIQTRLQVEKSARFDFDSTQSLLRFVQVGYGWAITSAFCLFQSRSALKELAIFSCPKSSPREFFLLHRKGELDAIAETAAQKFRFVFNTLVDGPWTTIAPQAAGLIRENNPS